MKRLFALTLLALALAGCAQGYTLVSGDRAKVHGALSIAPEGVWNKQEQPNHNEVWTLDGPAIQQLRFVVGVADGETILPRPTSTLNNPQPELPKFRATMTPIEVAELIVATLAQGGVSNIETKGLKPAKLGTDDGFRFELSYTSTTGLEIAGLGVGRIKDGKLYLLMYSAPKLYFFERDRARVERMMATVRFEA